MSQFRIPLRLMTYYPPLVGAGIRVKEASPAADRLVVQMKLRWWNANFARTHFGGSLYMMIDPFYALMLKQQLGAGYVIWDRAATIQFRAPGRSTVRAVFELPAATVERYRTQLSTAERLDIELPIEIRDDTGTLIADASKTIHIRRAKPPRQG